MGAAGIATLLAAGSSPAGASPPAAKSSLTAQAASAGATPGGVAEILVEYANLARPGSTTVRNPAFRIAAPAGYRFDGTTNLDLVPGFASGDKTAGKWTCRASGGSVGCAFAGSLASGHTLPLLLGFRVPDTARPGRHAIFRVTSGATSTEARIEIVRGPAFPVLYAESTTSTEVHASHRGVETVEILNTGPIAATGVQLSDLLPASVVGTWTTHSPGWTCSGSEGTPPACSTSTSIAPGALSPPLRLSFSLAPAKVAALGLAPGGKPKVEDWSIRVVADGGPHSYSAQSPAELAVAPPAAALLRISAAAKDDRLELLPGSTDTISTTVSNVGSGTTTGAISIGGQLPAGVRLLRMDAAGGWRCRGGETAAATAHDFGCSPTEPLAIAPGKSLTVRFQIGVAPDATPGAERIEVGAYVGNDLPSSRPPATELPLLILQPNSGFPGLTLLRPGPHGLAPASDGQPAQLVVGKATKERLDVTDAGGAELAAGSRIELTQRVAHASIGSVSAPAGWLCSEADGLTCTYKLATTLPTAGSLRGPTVSIVPNAATKGATDWPAEVHLVSRTAPKPFRIPVYVAVSRAVPRLVPNFGNVRVPTAGGTGVFSLDVRNDGNAPTSGPVVLGFRLPSGAHLLHASAHGWRCRTASGSASCVSATSLRAGHGLGAIRIVASFARRTGMKPLALTGRASVLGHAGERGPVARFQVEPRHSLRAIVTERDKVYFDDQPIVRPGELPKPTSITLEGDGSGGSGLGLVYRWTQRSGPPAAWLGPRNEADVQVQAPRVKKPTRLTFALTVSDGSATSTATVRVRVVPLPLAPAGFTIRHPHPQHEARGGPLQEKRRLPKPAEPLDPAPAPASAATRTPTTAHLPAFASASGQSTFCQLVQDAASSNGSFSAEVGGVSFGFADVHLSGSGCGSGVEITFAGGTFNVGQAVSASGVAGTITENGITFGAGTLKGPAAWHSPSFTLSGGGLSVPFGGSISLSGTVSGDGIAFVPLPSGWSGTTSLSFSAGGSDATSISASVSATGPKRDASPDSPSPSLSVDGAISTDGTFSLAFDVQQLVQIAGSAVNLSGSVTRSTADGPIAVSLSGSLAQPLTIVSGLQISTLQVTAKPTDQSLGLAGSGTVELTTPNGAVGVQVDLAYDDPDNWSLRATGAGSAAWEPVPGLRIEPKDFSGSIVAKQDKYELTLDAKIPGTWQPHSSVSISNLALRLSNTCPDTGAACPTDASIFFSIQGEATFALPSAGDLSTSLKGTLALPSGAFSVEAKLTRPLSLPAGISIDDARVLIERGMRAPSEEPTVESSDPGGFNVDLTGSVSLPGIGAGATVHASFSSRGWAIAAALGNFSLPGASGDGSKLNSAVVGWASYATKLQIVDPATKKVTQIDLPANGFKLTADFTAPSWIREMLGLGGDVHGRVIGTIDPARDTYALRMEFVLPGETYIYGDASSATNVALSSTFIEIARQGGDFNIALGGTALMTVKGSGGLDSSSVNLGLALSYSFTSQTVTGTLSFSSPNGWKDAFGARDLTLYDLAVAFSFNIPSLTPSIGFGARAVLPGDVRRQLGVANAARTTLVANISLTNPCVAIQVDDPTNTGKTVLDIGNGSLTATVFDLEIAPTGCTVGQFSYAPGISLQFAGTIAGIDVAIKATLGLNPFGFDGSADIGEIALDGLTIKKTHIEVALSTAKLKIAFSGGVEVLGTNVDISGKIAKDGSAIVSDFNGTLDQLTIGDSITAKDLAVSLHTENGPSKNVLEFAARGHITFFGSYVNCDFKLSIANGELNAAKADVDAKIVVGGLTLDGKFKLDYTKSSPLSVDARVRASYENYQLANASLTVRPGYFQVSAAFSVGGVFTADLEGAAYFGSVPAGQRIDLPTGGSVAAQKGDWYMAARNVSLSVAGFKGSANVWLGVAGSLTRAYVNGSVQILGTSGSNSVSVSGSVDGNGNFSLAGSARLDLAGFTPSVDVTVARQNGAVSVSGAASMAVLGSSISIRGDFRYDGGRFLFRLEGRGTIAPGGYTLSDTYLRFSNFPQDAGLYGYINLNAGSTLHLDGWININAQGGFFMSTNGYVDLRVVRVYGNVQFYSGARTECYIVPVWALYTFGPFSFWFPVRFENQCYTRYYPTTLNASATVNSAGFSFGVGMSIAGNGSFYATARTPTSGETTISTGTIDLFVVRGYAEFSYHMGLTVQSGYPYVSVDGAGSATIKYQHWEIRWWPWESGWSGWKTLGSVGVSIRTNPFRGCAYLNVAGKDVGGCIG